MAVDSKGLTVKDYSSIYAIKDFIKSDVAPKYFPDTDLDLTSIGLFGVVTETLGVVAEDGFIESTMKFKESFAIKAENAESLYAMAAVYQIEDMLATPASLNFYLLLNENDIITKGITNGEYTELFIDSDMDIKISDMDFKLDYDIKIMSKKVQDNYTHTVSYVMDYNNTLSNVNIPYIKSKIMVVEGSRYLVMAVNIRQVALTEYNEAIISNDKINISSLDFTFTNQLANFEIFYKAPGSDTYTQLTKKMKNTTKLTTPFCFYTIPDTNKLEIDFSNEDGYFSPAFNSEVKVRIFTTLGTGGNFTKYTGSNLNLVGKDTKYPSNKGLLFIGAVQDASRGGVDMLTMEELRQAVITAQTTVNSRTTTNDLSLFFKNMKNRNNNEILFMKRRDDVMMRLFTSFILMRDDNKRVIPSNTCDITIQRTDIDSTYTQTKRSIIKAGKIYKYTGTDNNVLMIDNTKKITDNLDGLEDEHIYTFPFLTVINTTPTSVGYYINSINDTITLDFDKANDKSFVQFILNTISITRNALLGEDKFKMVVSANPTSTLPTEAMTLVADDTKVLPTDRVFTNTFDGKQYIDNKVFKIIGVFEESGVETCWNEFKLVGYDGILYYFELDLTTDDYIALNNKVRLLESLYELSATNTAIIPEKYLSITGLKLNLYSFYKYDTGNISHDYEIFNILKGYTLTNKYTTDTTKIDLVVPVPQIRSNIVYNQFTNLEGKVDYNYTIFSAPMVKANYLKDTDRFQYFIKNFKNIYEYLVNETSSITTNYNLDFKLYNTFGRSKNYTLTDGKLLDKLNISIGFDFIPVFGIEEESLLAEIKSYINNYIEGDRNEVGNNAVYMSNLITKLETTFADNIDHTIYKGINNYPVTVQTLESDITDLTSLEAYLEVQSYVPEFINVHYKISNNVLTPQILLAIV